MSLVTVLQEGGVGVVPTDTLYGLCGSALQAKTVERIYNLRARNLKKPMIVLIGAFDDLKRFGITTTPAIKNALKKYWPGKVSVVLPVPSKKFRYLHRGVKSIAFRMPANAWLRNLLKETGPLVAPSANLEGKIPATTIKEAEHYFGTTVDFYIDKGKKVSAPSTLITFKNGQTKPQVLRLGAVKIQ